MNMVVIIILTIFWVICEAWFIISRIKNPLTWQENVFKKNKKYHLVQNSIGISGCILFLAWIGVLNAREKEKEQAIYEAEKIERVNHYKNLNHEILCRFDTISTCHSQVESFYGISSRFKVQLHEGEGISPQSKLIAFGITDGCVEQIWSPFNDELQKNGNYSECIDSIDYIVCISGRYETDYYGSTKLNYSKAEQLFVQIFDFNSLIIVDTMHIETRNPVSVRIKRGNSYQAIINVSPEVLYSRVFRKDEY